MGRKTFSCEFRRENLAMRWVLSFMRELVTIFSKATSEEQICHAYAARRDLALIEPKRMFGVGEGQRR